MAAWSSGTGNGAVAHSNGSFSSSSAAVRHSPSIAIATWPVWNGFLALNSSPKPVRYFSSFSKPPSLPTRLFCQSISAPTLGSVATVDLPSPSK